MKVIFAYNKMFTGLIICASLSLYSLQLHATFSIDNNSPIGLEIVEIGEIGEENTDTDAVEIDTSEDDLHVNGQVCITNSNIHRYDHVYIHRHYFTHINCTDFPPEW